MRPIDKGREPPSPIKHRKSEHADYRNYLDKEELRKALVFEQGGLCCYCMGRISDKQEKMKIEHWQCIANYPQNQLIYQNLLAACKGGEGQPPKDQHCDTRKADQDLLFNPADPDHHDKLRITYGSNGKIQSDGQKFDQQLNEILNLNYYRFESNRKKVYDGVMNWVKDGPISRKRIEKQIFRLLHTQGKLKPYIQVEIWWLKKIIADISS